MLTFDLLASKVKFASLFVWAIYIYIESIEGLEKCCITSACLQWLCHSGERIEARGPLVLGSWGDDEGGVGRGGWGRWDINFTEV